MEKIIICGNEGQFQEIKQRLNTQDADIIFFDLSKECLPRNLTSKDAIFIAADDLQEKLILENLSDKANDIQIVNYSCFKKTSLDNPIKNINQEFPYTGLIIGMSHSQCGIKAERLTDCLYCNCAAPSMDIFCHFNYLKILAEAYPDKLKDMRHIIIELPYYIFNFDLSRFGTFVYTKLNYFDLFDDYHHFGETDVQRKKIAEFKIFKKIFRSENATPTHSATKNPIRKIAKKIINKYRIAANKDKVWRVIYQETVNENQKLWKELLALLRKACPNAKLTILVMPFNPIFRRFHKKEISAMREVFIASLGVGDFEIIDHFSCLKRDCFFDDHCHLNEKGALKYVKILQKAIVNR